MPEDMAEPTSPSSAETQKTGKEEGAKPEGQEAGDAKAAGDKKEDDKKTSTDPVDDVADKEPEEKEPFHKHPRFQQLIGKNKELEKNLQEMQRQMEMMAKQTPGTKESSLDERFAEITRKLEDGDISMSEAMAEQRKLIEASSQQRIEQVMYEQQREAEASRIEEKFLSDNPDFVELRESGDLDTLISKNPMHDRFSAYYAHKLEAEQKAAEARVKDAVAKAVKETEERLRKEYTSKRNAASLNEGPAHVPSTPKEPEITTKGKTNLVATLAERLKNARAAASG
jgi:hypothetical protein